METWFVLLTAAILGLVIVAIGLNARRVAAEATLREIRSVASVDVDGDPLVAEVRQSYERVSASEAVGRRYFETLDAASIGIALLDASGDVQFANPVAERLLMGGGESAVLHARTSALVRRVSESGSTEQIVSDIHEPTRRVLTSTAVLVSRGSDASGTVAVYITDVSDRERVDAMRTDFVANASHELKTPLGALSILAETLAETQDEATRTRLASRLRSEAVRMAHVIDDIVRLAETESLATRFTAVNVSELVDGAADSVAMLASSKGIDLVRGEMATGVVDGSDEQMMSAVRNLLENAITYTAVKGEGGTVDYRVERSDGLMCIVVRDTGVGIAKQYIDRVFERFFRVDRARSRESGGTGLGLSIVRNVAQAHGGSVSVTSEVGVGSTFTIRIPDGSDGTV